MYQRKKKLRQVAAAHHTVICSHCSRKPCCVVVMFPSADGGKKIFGKLVHCSCTAQDVLAHFVAVVLYEPSRWMSFKTNSLPLQWRWALGVFYKMPIPFFFVCVSCLSLCPFSFFFLFLRHIRSTKQRKTIGACYLHFYVGPTSFFFPPLLRTTTTWPLPDSSPFDVNSAV